MCYDKDAESLQSVYNDSEKEKHCDIEVNYNVLRRILIIFRASKEEIGPLTIPCSEQLPRGFEWNQ